MKKIIVALLFVAIATPSAFAGKLRDNVGCGLGTLLFESTGNANGGWLFQLTASWTNASLYNGFSITTGTINCKGSINEVVNFEEANLFVADNIDALAKDVAQGHGETLNTLATLLNVDNKEAFSSNLQANFAVIFPNADLTSSEVLEKIIALG